MVEAVNQSENWTDGNRTLDRGDRFAHRADENDRGLTRAALLLTLMSPSKANRPTSRSVSWLHGRYVTLCMGVKGLPKEIF